MEELLPQVRGVYKFDYNLRELTWFKVGGIAKIFFKPKDSDDLVSFLQQNHQKLPMFVLGAGSNIVIRDGGIDGVVVRLGAGFTDIIIGDDTISVGAGCLNYNLAKFCLQNSIKNFEFLSTIPGTIGGGIAMNAGCYGSEYKDILIAVEALDFAGKKHVIQNSEIGFCYRGNNLPKDLIFVRGIFRKEQGDKEAIANRMAEIVDSRNKTQPIAEKTGGSTFANPVGFKAWELIDKAGLRGKRIGGARMSELHCNFMINDGTATASDIENLGKFVIAEVKRGSGIDLKWEIKIIGNK